MKRTLYLTALVFVFTGSLKAAEWRLLSPSSPHAERSGHGLVFDETLGHFVSFLGWTSLISGDLRPWVWNGQTWNLIETAGPCVRTHFGFTRAISQQSDYIFGGEGNSFEVNRLPIGDLWKRTSSRWTKLYQTDPASPESGPPSLFGAGLAFDEKRSRLVLFGGQRQEALPRGELWEWNGSQWELIPFPAAAGPSPRFGHSMVYDPIRKRVFLFGGQSEGNYFSDIWSWDGKDWKNEFPVEFAFGEAPPPRAFTAMTVSLHNRSLLIFGGERPYLLEDLWRWKDRRWEKLQSVSTSPLARSSAAMAYDPSSKKILMTGGSIAWIQTFSDTWELLQ